MRARQLLLSVTTALILITLPFVPLGAQPKEVVIGLLYPLSGPAASAGVDEKHAFELFADMVNGKEPMLPGAFYQQTRGPLSVDRPAVGRMVSIAVTSL